MPTITRRSKASSARETVYDRCAYMGCYNGKFINGRKLFHFPAETDRRLEMWIERSGNFRLRTWAAASLRKAGLCGDHFDESSFANSTRKKLRRNVVPRHYTEELEYRRSSRDAPRDVEFERTNEANDPLDCVELCGFPTESFAGYASRVYETRREFPSGRPIKLEPGTRSPSPVVEFIVEELDEALVRETPSSPSFGNVRDAGRGAGAEDRTNESSIGAVIEADENPCTGQADSRDERPVSNVAFDPGESDRLEVPWNEEESMGAAPYDYEEQPIPPCTRCPCTSKAEDLTRLRNENEQLRRALRLVERKLHRSSVRGAENAPPSDISRRNVDEFLDAQGCASPVARAMVKLALHKPKAPYTREEREFAMRLYRHSSAAFVDLQRYGCGFPGRNTVKRWIAEDEDKSTIEELPTTTKETGVDPEEADGGRSEPSMIDANDALQHRMSYVTRTIDSEVVVVDALVAEHSEVRTAAEEHVEASTTDDRPGEVFQ